MNPWLEEFWRDVHASLLVYARDLLNAELPPGLHARVDERLAVDAEEEQTRTYLPDVAVTESWDRPAGPVLGQSGQVVVAAEPTVVDFGQEILRHVEIVDSRAHVITAIELLSPSNKEEGEPRLAWKRKTAGLSARGHQPGGNRPVAGRRVDVAGPFVVEARAARPRILSRLCDPATLAHPARILRAALAPAPSGHPRAAAADGPGRRAGPASPG
jgi:hypothetical protein